VQRNGLAVHRKRPVVVVGFMALVFAAGLGGIIEVDPFVTDRTALFIAAHKIVLHCVSKKQDTKLLLITSPNVNRFSKFFHWQTHW